MPQLHPDRYSRTGVQARKHGVVIHCSESSDSSFAALVTYLQRPGDRVIPESNPPRRYGSGYHAVATPLGSYLEVADASMGPYHAPPTNKTWWAICIPGYARQTRDEWLDPTSAAYIRGVASYVVDKAAADGFPLVRLSPAELLAGDRGYCDHNDVSDAWGQTSHYDLGPNFPWDILAAEIAALTAPPPPPIPNPEDNVHVIVAIKNHNGQPLDNRRFAWDGISIRWIRNEEEFTRLYNNPWALFRLHPHFNSLTNPYLMPLDELRTYTGGNTIT